MTMNEAAARMGIETVGVGLLRISETSDGRLAAIGSQLAALVGADDVYLRPYYDGAGAFWGYETHSFWRDG